MLARNVAMPLGNHLTVHTWGNPEGPPVVVAHGFMDSAVSFEPAMRPLMERFHVFAPDQRGHGASDHVGPGGYYHFTDYVLDMHALVQHIQAEAPEAGPPVMIGHSMGASVSIYLAGAFPELFRGLILVDGIGPPSGSGADGPALMRRWIERVTTAAVTRNDAVPQEREKLLRRLRGSTPGLMDADREKMVDARTRATSNGGGDGDVQYRFDRLHKTPGPWHIDAARFNAFCEAIAIPTLSIWGSNTPFRHSEVAQRLALITHHREVTVQGAGHNIHLERPLQLGQLCADFVCQLDSEHI